MKDRSGKIAAANLFAISILTTASFAFLLLRDTLPLPLLIATGALWVLQICLPEQLEHGSPMNPLILCLIILLPINLLVTLDLFFTLSKIYSLLLAFSYFGIIVSFVQYRKHVPLLIFGLVALAVSMALLGSLATEWTTRESAILTGIFQILPNIGEHMVGVGINKNTMGGALTFFPALLLSLLFDSGSFTQLLNKYIHWRKFPDWIYKFVILLILLFVVGVLLLTQSRGAWLGALFGAYVLLVWKDKRLLWLIPVGLVLLVLFVRSSSDGSLLGFLYELDQGQGSTLPSRIQIWWNTINIIEDFPITGIGLDGLSVVYPMYFKSFVLPETVTTLHHAHNSLLTVALETGIPGLILYIAMLSCFGFMAWHSHKRARSLNRVLIKGLVSGMIAHQVFGLLDAFSFGKYLGVTMWIYFAAMTTIFVHRHQMIHTQSHQSFFETSLSKSTQVRLFLRSSGIWFVFSFIAITFSQYNIYVSLLVALFAGSFLGWFVVSDYLALVKKLSIANQKELPAR